MIEKKRVAVFHNILWAKYKGAVFSSLYSCANKTEIEFDFFQIAETEKDRLGLSGVDLAYHDYPFKLFFEGAYDDVPISNRILTLFTAVLFGPRYDLLVLPGYHNFEYWAMLLAAIIRRTPRAVFCDSTANDRPRNFLKSIAKRFFFSRCQGFFCYGERSSQYLKMYGVPSHRIFHRVQAAALPLSYNPAQIPMLRKEQLNAAQADILLYVGRLSKEKNLLGLLEAFRRVRANYSDSKLYLIGNGPQRAELEAFVTSANLSEHVTFFGGMSPEQLANYYLGATALILPSYSEPWGLVVNEAMSYGCPVIVSDACGCLPELVVIEKTGFSFRSGDVDDMAFAIESLLSTDVDRAGMSRLSLEVISDFTPRHAAMQIIYGVKKMVAK